MSSLMSSHVNGLKPLIDAIDFAAKKHKNQRRKDAHDTPYINHPIAVAKRLVDAGHDRVPEDVAMLQAAILHDTIEDTDTTAEEISRVFGVEVSELVLACTDNKELSWQARKDAQSMTNIGYVMLRWQL